MALMRRPVQIFPSLHHRRFRLGNHNLDLLLSPPRHQRCLAAQGESLTLQLLIVLEESALSIGEPDFLDFIRPYLRRFCRVTLFYFND